MRQHTINLLPDSVRVRAQAGVRVRRASGLFASAVLVLVILAIHARVQLHLAGEIHEVTEARANRALALEAKSNELNAILQESQTFIDRYKRIAFPIDVTSVIATMINALPPSVTLERVDLSMDRKTRSPRSRGSADEKKAAPRELLGEISGIAASDHHIAELVAVLEAREPFRNVSLDFSRSRPIRGRSAREFRLSFRIDLDQEYEIVMSEASLGRESHVE